MNSLKSESVRTNLQKLCLRKQLFWVSHKTMWTGIRIKDSWDKSGYCADTHLWLKKEKTSPKSQAIVHLRGRETLFM